jgi:hypothetical protein
MKVMALIQELAKYDPHMDIKILRTKGYKDIEKMKVEYIKDDETLVKRDNNNRLKEDVESINPTLFIG